MSNYQEEAIEKKSAIKPASNQEMLEMMARCKYEIEELRRQVEQYKPKADAYQLLSSIVNVIIPQAPVGAKVDLLWLLNKRIKELSEGSSLGETQG